MVTCTSRTRGVLRKPQTSPAVGNRTTPPDAAQATAIRCSSVGGQLVLASTPRPTGASRPVRLSRSTARRPAPPDGRQPPGAFEPVDGPPSDADAGQPGRCGDAMAGEQFGGQRR